jgi:hypothetical protein
VIIYFQPYPSIVPITGSSAYNESKRRLLKKEIPIRTFSDWDEAAAYINKAQVHVFEAIKAASARFSI